MTEIRVSELKELCLSTLGSSHHAFCVQVSWSRLTLGEGRASSQNVSNLQYSSPLYLITVIRFLGSNRLENFPYLLVNRVTVLEIIKMMIIIPNASFLYLDFSVEINESYEYVYNCSRIPCKILP